MQGALRPEPGSELELRTTAPAHGDSPSRRSGRARSHLRLGAFAMLLASVGLSVAGQFWFANRREYLVDGVILYLAGLVLFAVVVKTVEAPAAPSADRAGVLWRLVVANWLRLSLSGLGLLFAAAAGLSAAATPQPANFTPAIVMWLGGCALVLAAQLPAPVAWRAWPPRGRTWLYAHRFEIFAVALWLALGGALRLWQLGELPYPVSGDEASMGLEARKVLNGELRNPFATSWLSHPTMWFFWQSPFLAILGPDVLGMRFMSALIGANTILAVYLLAREMFGLRVGQISAAIMAAYPYHVHFSRQAMNNISDPWLAAWTFYLLYRGLQRRERLSMAIGGAALGLMQYGYLGARVVPIIAGVYLGYLLLAEREFLRGQIGGLVVFAAGALVVALPIVFWYAAHLQDLTARLAIIGIFQSGWLDAEALRSGRSTLQILWDQIQRSLLAFNYYLDTGPHYHSPGPLLGFWPSLCFAFGGAYAALRWRERRAMLLLLWIVLTLVFGGVLTISPPFAPRLVVLIPAVCILVAVGLEKVITLFAASAGLTERTKVGALALSVGLIMLLDVAFYFGEYLPKPHFSDGNTEIATLAGQYLARLDDEYKVYFFGPPRMYVGHPSFIYTAGGKYTKGADVGVDIAQPLPANQRPAMVQRDNRLVFIFLPERIKEMETVRTHFPGGTVEQFGGRFAKDLFTIYRVD